MIRNKMGILVPDTPVMRDLVPKMPNSTPIGVFIPAPTPLDPTSYETPFYFENRSDGTINVQIVLKDGGTASELLCSKDGHAWKAFDGTESVKPGWRLYLRGTNVGFDYTVDADGAYSVGGNIRSLFAAENYDVAEITADFNGTFENSVTLVDASDLQLGNMTLQSGSFEAMFKGCTSLVQAPELPYTTLAENCYKSMFEGCSSMVTAPELPAETVATGAYIQMFKGCSSLSAITIGAKSWTESNSTDWVEGVANEGVFTCGILAIGTNDNSIPTGWIKDAPDVALQTLIADYEGYNPAVSIKIEQAGYGTYIDANDKTKGWYLTKEAAAAMTTIPSFNAVTQVQDVNGICGTVGSNYNFTSFDELIWFDGLTSIPEYEFVNCTNLVSVAIPKNVETLGTGALGFCSALTSVVFAENSRLKSVQNSAFRLSTSLREIEFPETLETIGEDVFNGCTIEVTINSPILVNKIKTDSTGTLKLIVTNKVTSLPVSFCEKSTINEVSLPNSISSISSRAFVDCSHLTKVELSNGLTTISEYGICNTGVTSLTIPASVTSIGANGMSVNNSLTKVSFDDNSMITYIGNEGFRNCPALTEFKITALTPPALGVNVFNNSSNLAHIYVPAGSVDVYKAASGWSDYSSIIEAIPNN